MTALGGHHFFFFYIKWKENHKVHQLYIIISLCFSPLLSKSKNVLNPIGGPTGLRVTWTPGWASSFKQVFLIDTEDHIQEGCFWSKTNTLSFRKFSLKCFNQCLRSRKTDGSNKGDLHNIYLVHHLWGLAVLFFSPYFYWNWNTLEFRQSLSDIKVLHYGWKKQC